MTIKDETADALNAVRKIEARERYAKALDGAGGAGAQFIRDGHTNLWAGPAIVAIAAALSDRATDREGEAFKLCPSDRERMQAAFREIVTRHTVVGGYPDTMAIAHDAYALAAPARQPIADLTGEAVRRGAERMLNAGLRAADLAETLATEVATLTARLAQAEGFRPVEEWDKRDEIVMLLVDYSEDGDHPLDDADIAITIGHNGDHNVGEGEGQGWQFAGWCWTHDHYVEGKGKVIGWMPLPHHLAVRDALADPQAGGKGGAE